MASRGVVIDCGERTAFTGSVTTYPCGVDHAPVVRDEMEARWLEEGAIYPWRSSGDTGGLPF